MPHLCPRCNERETELGYCKVCKSEYSRIWKSNHKKSPPKGELKGNWRKAERDPELPPITTVYRSFYDSYTLIHGWCKQVLSFRGEKRTLEGVEFHFYCECCLEGMEVPSMILARLSVWKEVKENETDLRHQLQDTA